MYAIKVRLEDAEKVKRELRKEGFFDNSRQALREEKFIFFPVSEEKITIAGTKIVKKDLKKIINEDYKERLKKLIPNKLHDLIPNSFDTIGDIIIIEIKEEIEAYEKKIAKEILEDQKSIKTILKKAGQHEGEFRTQKLAYLAGIDTKETIYKENDVRLKLDVEEVYFSPRLSTERKRIFTQVKKDEEILVMFSGCGPYPLVISKNTEAKGITAIEKNPTAHKYAELNKILNKVDNVEFICGDVREIIPTLNIKFDRILMPLPKDAETFLDVAFIVSKKGTKIHLYGFEHETEIDNIKDKIKKEADKKKIKYYIEEIVKCGQYSPGKFRICADFYIL